MTFQKLLEEELFSKVINRVVANDFLKAVGSGATVKRVASSSRVVANDFFEAVG